MRMRFMELAQSESPENGAANISTFFLDAVNREIYLEYLIVLQLFNIYYN